MYIIISQYEQLYLKSTLRRDCCRFNPEESVYLTGTAYTVLCPSYYVAFSLFRHFYYPHSALPILCERTLKAVGLALPFINQVNTNSRC